MDGVPSDSRDCFAVKSWGVVFHLDPEPILCLESCKFLLMHVVALSLVHLMTYLQFGC